MGDFFRGISQWFGAITAEDIEPYKGPIGIAILVLAAAGFGLWLYWEKRRREAFAAKAKELGLRFDPGPNYDIPPRIEFLNPMGRGKDRYAFNIMQGVYRGHPVRCFDYHYATGGKDSTSHYFSVYLLHHPVQFPKLEIDANSFFSRVGQALGMETIKFESAAFNRIFSVTSTDRRFAYDVCHPRMMAFLLQNPDISLEIEQDCIAICYMTRQKVKEVQPHLDLLVDFRELMPEHLYPRQGSGQ